MDLKSICFKRVALFFDLFLSSTDLDEVVKYVQNLPMVLQKELINKHFDDIVINQLKQNKTNGFVLVSAFFEFGKFYVSVAMLGYVMFSKIM